jgi:repressor LexA
MEELTKRQRQVYGFLSSFLEEHGYPPTIREIQRHFRLASTKGVKDHLDRLEAKGYISRLSGSARAIELTGPKEAEDVVQVPVVGRVAAGSPVLATENVVGTIPVSRSVARGDGFFFLRVQGDSMVDAAILDGDLVLVRPQPFVEQGRIAVVMVGDEATVKRFYREGGAVRLVPENPDYSDIVIPEGREEVRVLGRVVAVIRDVEGQSGLVT